MEGKRKLFCCEFLVSIIDLTELEREGKEKSFLRSMEMKEKFLDENVGGVGWMGECKEGLGSFMFHERWINYLQLIL